MIVIFNHKDLFDMYCEDIISENEYMEFSRFLKRISNGEELVLPKNLYGVVDTAVLYTHTEHRPN